MIRRVSGGFGDGLPAVCGRPSLSPLLFPLGIGRSVDRVSGGVSHISITFRKRLVYVGGWKVVAVVAFPGVGARTSIGIARIGWG